MHPYCDSLVLRLRPSLTPPPSSDSRDIVSIHTRDQDLPLVVVHKYPTNHYALEEGVEGGGEEEERRGRGG